MVSLFGVLGVFSLLAGVVFLSNATAGVGLIGVACFFGICGRISQAERDTKLLLAAVSQPARPVSAPVQHAPIADRKA